MVAPKIKMKAILHKEFGGPEVLVVTNDVEICLLYTSDAADE